MELPGADYDNIRDQDGIIELNEAPDMQDAAKEPHHKLIEIFRRCPRSIFFASSRTAVNENTLSLNDVLTELKRLAADKAYENYLETISEVSQSDRESNSRRSEYSHR